MAFSQDFHINFSREGATYDLNLVKGEKSDYLVKINGVSYSILGEKEKLDTACEILKSVSLDSISSSEDLKGRLSLRGDISFTPIEKTEDVGKKALNLQTTSLIPQESYFNTLKRELAPNVPLGGGAMVAILKGGQEAEFIPLGTSLVEGSQSPNKDTAALIGSGAKMFTALLSKILEEKGVLVLEENELSPKSKLSDFMRDEHFLIFEDPEAARDITLESLLSHTSGLQFFADDNNNSRKGQSLDTILDGMVKEVSLDKFKAVKFSNNPNDGIYSYSNQIGLVAVCIEKAYEKKIVKDLIQQKKLDGSQPIKQLEPIRIQLKIKIEEAEKHIEYLKNKRDRVQSGSSGRAKKGNLNIQINAHEQRLKELKAVFQGIPETLQDLLDYPTATIQGVYIYQILDEILESSGNHPLKYAEIMKTELLEPLKMARTSFQRPQDSNVLEACVIKEGQKTKAVKEDILDPMMRGAGGLWSSASDMMKLATAFTPNGELIAQDKTTLISKKGVAELATIRGINGKTGLALDIEGSVIGKGGGISTYDFKFKFDTSTRNAMVSMCNFKGAEKEFNSFVTRAVQSLEDMNPSIKASKSPTSVSEPEQIQKQLLESEMENCTEFFSGKQGCIGVKRTDFGIIVNWNGVKLPAKGKEGHFVIFGGGPHDGKEIVYREGKGSQKTQYLFVEKSIDSFGFTKTSRKEVIILEKLNFPKDTLGVEGTYKSPHPDGPKPIKVTANESGLFFVYGNNTPVPGHITNIKRDKNDDISEIWVMTIAEPVPDKLYKLIKDRKNWSLAISLFENPLTNLELPFPNLGPKR